MRRSLLAAATACAVLVFVSCSDDAAGPRAPLAGQLAIVPSFGTLQGGIVEIARGRFVLTRIPGGEVAKDTVIAIAADADSVDLSLTVPVFGAGETFNLTISLITDAGDTVFRGGPLEVSPSTSGTPVPVEVPFTYVGTGADAAAVRILTPDTTTLTGDSVLVVAQAEDAGAAAILNTPIGWESLDTAIVRIVGRDAQYRGRAVGGTQRGVARIVATLVTGQRDTMLISNQPLPTSIVAESGNDQSARADSTLPLPLVARVTAADGQGVAGLWVRFAETSGGGSVSADSVLTDAAGRAAVQYTMARSFVPHVITASTARLTPTALFNATLVFEAPATLEIVAGNSQTATAGSAVAVAPQVRVLDADGLSVPGVTVTFSVTGGAGIVAGGTPVTDNDGLAAVSSWTVGPTAGINTLQAAVSGRPPVTFTATGVAGPATQLVLVSGNTQTGQVGAALALPLVVRATDSNGNPVPGGTVNWTTGLGGLSAASTITDDAGLAQVLWTLGTAPGAHAATAALGGTSATVDFTATAIPGNATRLAFTVQPSNGMADAAITPAVQVTAYDVFDNLATGFTGSVQVALLANPGSATLGGTTTTAAVAGIATFADLTVSAAGTGYTLQATATGLASATSAGFTVAPPSGQVAWINASGGAWGTGSNWSTGAPPAATDTALITLAGTYTVQLDQSATVQRLVVGAATGVQTFQQTANALTVADGAVFGANSAYQVSGGSFAGAFSNAGTMTWGGGTLVGSSSLTNSGTLTLSTASAKTLGAAATLTNTGTVFHVGSGSLVLGLGAIVTNGPGALLDFQSDADIDWVSGTSPEPFVNNQGTIRKSAGTGQSFIDQLQNLGGTLDVQTGELELRSYDGTTNTSTGGTLTVAPTATLDLTSEQDLNHDEGAYQGTYTGSGGGTVLLDNGVLHAGTGVTFNLPGTMLQWQAGTIADGPFSNAGTLTLSGTATRTLAAAATLTNLGTLTVEAGTLLVAGTFSHAAGAVLQGSGTVDLSAATVSAFEGEVRPGTSPGTITIVAPTGLTFGAGASVGVELGGNTTAGTDFDQLLVTGQPITLGGTLNVTLVGAYTPAFGDLYPVMVFPQRSGTFSSVTYQTVPGILWDTVWAEAGSVDTLFVRANSGLCGGTPNSLPVVTVSRTAFCSAANIVGTAAEALDLVQPGGTIQFESGGGNFPIGNLTVAKPVTFQSADAGSPTLDGSIIVSGVASGTVTVTGLTFINAGYANVQASGTYDQVVVNASTFIVSATAGVYAAPSSVTGARVTVSNSAFSFAGSGLMAVFGANTPTVVDILDNVVTGPSSWGAFQFQSGATGRIEGNTATQCGRNGCINVNSAAAGVVVSGNTVSSSPGSTTTRGISVVLGGAGTAVTNNTVNGGFSGGDPTLAASYGYSGGALRITGTANGTQIVSGNTLSGAVFGIEGAVSGALQSAQNNVISTVLTGLGNSFAASPFTSNDIASYVNPFALGAPNGALTCNWWGNSGGPQNVPAGADPAVFTPWATGPIANGAGGSCDGTPVAPNLNAWTGVGDGASWSDGANWSKGVAPIETDSVVIAASGTYTVTIGAGLNPTIEHLLLGDASGTQTLDLNGNDLTVTNTATVEAGGDLFVRSSLTSGLGTTNRGQIRITGVVPSVSTLSGGLDNLGLVIARSANFTGPVTTGPSSTIRTEGAVDFGSGFTNNGLLEFGGDGTSGFVRIAGGSGTLVNAATGTLTSIAASGSTINRLIGNLENQGTVEVSEVQFNLAQGGAVLTNSGTINASGADLSLSTGSTGVLTTTGPINVSDGRLVQIQGPTLDIAAGGSIQGGGTLGFAGGALTTASNLVIGPGGLDSLRAFSATLSGPGSITVEAGGTLLFANTTVNSPVNSTGLITVLSTSSVSSAFVNQGTLDIRTGTLSFAAALTHGLGATLLGNGTLDLTSATVLGFDGAVNPGTSPGQLTITGPVTYGGTASLNIELAGTTVGTEYDQLIHTGAIGLNGQLVIDASGFTPTVGDRFAVLVFPSRIGGFAGVTLPTIAGLVLDTLWAEAGTTDTLFVVANAEAPPGPPGTETVWLGTVDGDWTNPANWFGGNVPDDTMNTFIPAGTPFTPVIGIGADLDVDTLVVEDGASLGVDGALTVYGDLAAGTTSISGGGSLTLAGVSGTVSGTVPDLTVAGNYTVTGDLVVNGDLLLQGFDSTAPDVPGTNLRINGNDVLVTGDFTTALFGRLHMLSAADTLEIQGNATFNGDETVNALTAGVLLVAGNFTQQGSIRSASFHPTGGHKTVLNGSATQTVSFENTALRLSTFASLEITNVVGVTFATPITALGTITVPVPIAISTLQRLEADGGLTLDPGASLTAPYLGFGGTLDVEAANFTVDTVAVSNGSLPGGLPYVTVYVVGAGGELLGPTTVSDDLHVQADFDVNGQTLVVAGNLIVSGGSLARLVMASPDDSVVVEGDATFNGAAYTGVPGTGLEAGVLEVQGNFTQTGTVGPFPAGGNNFVASGSHITHFTGPNPEISFSHPDSSWFHHVIMQTGESPVALLTDVTATGDLTIPLGVQGLQAVSSGITVLGAVTAESDLAVQGLGVFGTLNAAPAVYTVENTIFGGPSPQTIPDSLLYQNVSVVADASLMGDTDLTGILNVTGDPQGNTAGALTVGPYSLYVGQLVVNGSGILRMTDPGGVVNVTGNAIFDGSATVGELTAGELRVGGDFTQLDSNGDGLSFVADAGHVTEFQGDGPQNILFMSPGVGASQFGSLLITNSAAPVVLQSDARSVGASSIATSATLDLGTSTFDVNGAFTHPAGAVLQGSGTLDLTDATVSALDGVVNPGSSPGLLSLVAPSGLTLGSTAAVNIEVGGPTPGTEHDRLATSAAVTLDGAMNVALIDAFTPLAADSFEVLTFGTRTGNFSGVAPLALGGGLFLDTLWSATGMALVARRVVATDGSPIDLTTNTVSDRVYALVAPGTTTSVVVFDASTDQPLNTIPLPDAFNPYAVRVNPTSEKIYVSDFQGGVTVLDGLTGSITGTIAVSQPGFTTVDEANDLVYLTARVQSVSPCPPFTCSIDVPALLKIDGTMDTVFTADTVHIGGQNDQAFGIAFNPNDGFVYVAVYDAPGYVKIVDPATNALVDSIAVPDDPWAVALNPVTNRLYVSSDADNSVTVVDLATRSVVTSIPIGGYIPNLSVDPVLDRVYAVNFDNSTVVVIDGATSSVLKAVQVGAPGDGAYAAVPSPAAPAIYVARYNAGEITITRR